MNEDLDPRRLVFPGLAHVYGLPARYAYPIVRLCTGAFLVPHGYQKLFQGVAPAVAPVIVNKVGLAPGLAWAYFVAGVEFFGGIMIAIGLLTRLAAMLAAIELLVIVVFIKSAAGFFAAKGGYEYELFWAILCLVIFCKGGGRHSVDRAFGKEL